MKMKVQMSRFFPLDRFELFDYFVTPRLLEQWAYPDQMTLKIPIFENKLGGKYRYEHSSKNGLFVCDGVVKEFLPGEKLVQLDYAAFDPEGHQIFENLESIIKFRPKMGGTEVSLLQIGFDDEKMARDCAKGWKQCLDHLQSLIKDKSSADKTTSRTTENNLNG